MALSDISKLTASAGFTERNDPFNLFGEWLKEAEGTEPNDANAMALATVDEEVERAPFLRDRREGRVHRGHVGDVAGNDDLGAQFGSERLDALLERIALVGEGELRALGGTGLGDTPGDGPVVGNPHDEAALASHQTLVIAHD